MIPYQMNLKKSKKVYNLEYIEKIFKIIPLSFIIILSFFSIVLTYIILESKQDRDIDLLRQKQILHNEFDKKEKLTNFSTLINKRANNELSRLSKRLQEHTYKIIGTLDTSIKKDRIDNIIEFLQDYEESHDINIVLFEKSALDIIYGHDKIVFLSELIFGKYEKKYKDIVLQYIYSQGRYNLQEWKNDLTGALKLSFFDTLKIDGKSYYLGAFSKTENIRFITKNLLIEEIDLLKKSNDYSIWFLDLITKMTYNFKNKNLYDSVNVLLTDNKNEKKYQVLNHFDINEDMNNDFDNFILYNSKYKLVIAVDYKENINFNSRDITSKYNNLFLTIVTYIILIATVLVLFSLVFSNFTKNILDRYNRKLNLRTASLTHWKNRFELAIIASNDGLWDIDFTDNKIYFSNKWLEIAGYEKGEIDSFSDWFNLIYKDEKTKVEQMFEEIFANKREDFFCEYRLKTKNDGFKWILARGKLFTDSKTNKKRMLMMSMDIDKNKRMKKELLDVELLVEDGKIVIFKLFNDENLSVKYISNSIKNYGYTKQHFENNEMNFLDLIYKEDINIVKVAFNAAINNNLSDFTFVCRALNAANEIRWINCRTLILKGHAGNVVSFYGYINDITKIKVSEQELKLKVEEELSKNRDKDRLLIQQSKLAAMGEMLGNIAHQWRQPLNNVSLILQFLKDNYQNENANLAMINKYFDKSFTQIEYMSQTIDDFRNFYKPSKAMSEFKISDSLDSTLEIIRAQLQNENIELIIDIEDTTIRTFENELKQSFLNILNNAQDAIHQKKSKEKFDAYIKITTKTKESNLIIYIENNGGEIKVETISKIFEPYFTTKFETQGTGIGLYMTKSIIETNMNGRISVENISGGVCFKISLPLNMDKKA
ncbi:MAG: hypothetical protein C0625_05800 [Arcobacter sp.]|nr:MAG: hypothetical protein C0625_05800 [Arcobacter sp.]